MSTVVSNWEYFIFASILLSFVEHLNLKTCILFSVFENDLNLYIDSNFKLLIVWVSGKKSANNGSAPIRLWNLKYKLL